MKQKFISNITQDVKKIFTIFINKIVCQKNSISYIFNQYFSDFEVATIFPVRHLR